MILILILGICIIFNIIMPAILYHILAKYYKVSFSWKRAYYDCMPALLFGLVIAPYVTVVWILVLLKCYRLIAKQEQL